MRSQMAGSRQALSESKDSRVGRMALITKLITSNHTTPRACYEAQTDAEHYGGVAIRLGHRSEGVFCSPAGRNREHADIDH